VACGGCPGGGRVGAVVFEELFRQLLEAGVLPALGLLWPRPHEHRVPSGPTRAGDRVCAV
jgi:hypothetical protein